MALLSTSVYYILNGISQEYVIIFNEKVMSNSREIPVGNITQVKIGSEKISEFLPRIFESADLVISLYFMSEI